MKFKNIKDLENKIKSITKLDELNVPEIEIEEVNGEKMKLINVGVGLKNGLYEVAFLNNNGPEMIRVRFEKDGDNIVVKEIVDRLNGPRTDN